MVGSADQNQWKGRRPCEHGGQGRVLLWCNFRHPYVESHVISGASVKENSAVACKCPAFSGKIGE